MKALHAGHLLRLAAQELAQEQRRLFRMFGAMLLAGLLLLCGLLALSALLVVTAWSTPWRVYTLSALLVVYLAGAAMAWRRFEALERLGDNAMERTRQELADTMRRIENSGSARTEERPRSLTMQLLTQEPGLLVFLATELLPSLVRRLGRRRARKHRAAQRDAGP